MSSKIWRPFTQEKTTPAPVKITKGRGVYLYDENDNKYLDMISSWWVNILGHSNEEIADAISEQSKKLEHVIFTKFVHDPAEKLCKKLQELLPPKLSHFFFSDDGSTSVEVALKMCYQYHKNVGDKNRKSFLNLEGGYHGDTIGAMSLAGKDSQYHSAFSELFFETISVAFPYNDMAEEQSLIRLRALLEERGNEFNALIVEPLLQGSAGMRPYSASFLNQVVEEVRKHGILVIFDEVMTGFYRTGTMFAMEQTNVIPDVLCLSKGLTGGFLPLGLTVATDHIYNEFLSDDPSKTFIHGHSYTGNPVCCAAACKTIEILSRPEVVENIKKIEQIHKSESQRLKMQNKRVMGTVFAGEVESAEKALAVCDQMFARGIFLRPLCGNTLYFMPPYCITEDELKFAYNELENVI